MKEADAGSPVKDVCRRYRIAPTSTTHPSDDEERRVELVQFKANGGVVSIRFSFSGTIVWRYDYVSDDNSDSGFLFTGTSQDVPPYLHALGHSHELQNDIDVWDVTFANIANSKRNYKVVLAWEQDGKILHKWQRTGSLASGKTVQVSGDAVLVGG